MAGFVASIREGGRGGALVVIPDDVIDSLGGGGRIPVTALIDDVSYSGSIVRMGGEHVLGVLKAIRSEIGKDVGDEVSVEVVRDTSERIVRIPDELRRALDADPVAAGVFEGLSYSHQREYSLHVSEAKRSDTRQRRAAKAVEMLKGSRESGD